MLEAGGGVVEELAGVAGGAGCQLGEPDAGVGEPPADGFVQDFPAVAGGGVGQRDVFGDGGQLDRVPAVGAEPAGAAERGEQGDLVHRPALLVELQEQGVPAGVDRVGEVAGLQPPGHLGEQAGLEDQPADGGGRCWS
jgi:hypothetical protein